MRYRACAVWIVVLAGLAGCAAPPAPQAPSAAVASPEPKAADTPFPPPGPIIILQPPAGTPTPDSPLTWSRKNTNGTITTATHAGSIFDTVENGFCDLRHDVIGTEAGYLKATPLGASAQAVRTVVLDNGSVSITMSWNKTSPLGWTFKEGEQSCFARSVDLESYDDFVLPEEFDGFQVKHVIANDDQSENVEAWIEWVK